MSKTVLHLVPYDAFGGVETAVRSVPSEWSGPAGPVHFRRAYLTTHSPITQFADDWHGPVISVNHPKAHWRLLRFALQTKAHLIVASLWRCCPALIALKILRPKTKTVLCLHSAVDVHLFDQWLTGLAMRVVDEIWADAITTLEARVPPSLRNRARVLSYLTERTHGAAISRTIDKTSIAAPRFVFWGRLQSEKNLELTLDVFAAIHRLSPRATLDIIGPDRGALAGLQTKVIAFDLGDAVTFVGALSQETLLVRAQHYDFYLQTSHFEGMAMSVVEAMALGLVPIVTPVGEISRYCIDGNNGIHVTTPQETAQRVAELIANPIHWQELSKRAAEKWASATLFRDDYRASCDQLLSRNQPKGEG